MNEQPLEQNQQPVKKKLLEKYQKEDKNNEIKRDI